MSDIMEFQQSSIKRRRPITATPAMLRQTDVVLPETVSTISTGVIETITEVRSHIRCISSQTSLTCHRNRIKGPSIYETYPLNANLNVTKYSVYRLNRWIAQKKTYRLVNNLFKIKLRKLQELVTWVLVHPNH